MKATSHRTMRSRTYAVRARVLAPRWRATFVASACLLLASCGGSPGSAEVRSVCEDYCNGIDECPLLLPDDFPLTCVDACRNSAEGPCGSEFFELRRCNVPVDACRDDAPGCEPLAAASEACLSDLESTCRRCEDLVSQSICESSLGYCVAPEIVEQCLARCPDDDFGRLFACLEGRAC